MPVTSTTGRQIRDGSVQRVDLDISTVGQAVTSRIAAGTLIGLSSTGADSGTGVVTISVTSPIPIANGGSGQTTAQAAINALSLVSAATNEHVLTKDTSTGNALWKASGSGLTIGTINSQTKAANGAVIASGALVLQSADASFPGLVTTGTQTFAGAKTFSADMTMNNNLIYTRFTTEIAANTADASDNKSIMIQGGGSDAANAVGRGGWLRIYGNEVSSPNGGTVTISAGNVVDGKISLYSFGVQPVQITLGNQLRWTFDSSGRIIQHDANGSDLVFGRTTGIIRQDTVDAADNKSLAFAGGGATGTTRGATLTLNGNEAASGGVATLISGNASTTGTLTLGTGGNAGILFQTNGTIRHSIDGTGDFVSHTHGRFRQNTSDGSDNRDTWITAGGGFDFFTGTRGGNLILIGNESPNGDGGFTYLGTGQVANAVLELRARGTGGYIWNSTDRVRFGSLGTLRFVENSTNDFVISTDKTVGNDTGALSIAAGGAADVLGTRGAGIIMKGHNAAGDPGNCYIFSGTNGNIFLAATGAGGAIFQTNGLTRWFVQGNTGTMHPATNNAYDIGHPSTRVRDIYSVNALNISDQRIKQDILEISNQNALDKVCATRPVTYTFKPSYDVTGRLRAGFLAQEIVNHIPESVIAGDSDNTLDHTHEDFESWSMQNDHIIPYLVAAIKQLKADNEALQLRVLALETH